MLKRKEKAERRHARSADKSRQAEGADAPPGADPGAELPGPAETDTGATPSSNA